VEEELIQLIVQSAWCAHENKESTPESPKVIVAWRMNKETRRDYTLEEEGYLLMQKIVVETASPQK